MSALRAIIFDCDGVIADTEPVHYEAFARVLAEQGLPLTREDYYGQCLGYDDRGVFVHVFGRARRELEDRLCGQLLARKRRMYLKLIQEKLVRLPGVEQFVRRAATRWVLAICSGAIRREVDYILECLGVAACFSVIVTADVVGASKPDPEGYLLALRLLRETGRFDPPLQAGECLVIEDSLPGVQAAHAAGMAVLAVTTAHPAEQLRSAEAVVGSLAEVDEAFVERLVGPGAPGR